MKKALLLAVSIALVGTFTTVNLPDANAQSARDVLAELAKIRTDNPAFKIDFRIEADKNSFNSGEEVKFQFSSEQDGYLTILDVGTSGEALILFPNEWNKSSKVEKGVTYSIPPADAKFKYVVKTPSGTENIKAIVSASPIIPEFGDAPSKGLEKKGPFMKFKNPKQGIKDIAVQQMDSKQGSSWTVADVYFTISEGQGTAQGSPSSSQQGTNQGGSPGFSSPSK